MKFTKNLGMLLLAIWLIAWGATALFNISFTQLPTLLEVLAIAAGIFILLGK